MGGAKSTPCAQRNSAPAVGTPRAIGERRDRGEVKRGVRERARRRLAPAVRRDRRAQVGERERRRLREVWLAVGVGGGGAGGTRLAGGGGGLGGRLVAAARGVDGGSVLGRSGLGSVGRRCGGV